MKGRKPAPHWMKMTPMNVIPAKAGIQQGGMECVPPMV
jgi:hypothetical protein